MDLWTIRIGLLGVMLSAAVGLGCGNDAKQKVEEAPVEQVRAPVITPPGVEQEKRFVDALKTATTQGNAAAFNAMIDWNAVTRRAARDLFVPTQVLQRVAEGAREGCAASGVCFALAAIGKGKAKLRYLGPFGIGNERWVSFRRLPVEGGFDHVSFLLSVDAQGVAHAMDVLVLSLGETSSKSLRRALLPMIAVNQDHKVRRMLGTDSAFARHGADISRAQQLATQGKPTEALALLNALPAALRSDPLLMAQRVTITRMTGDEQAYLTAIDDLAARHPNEPITLLNQLDSFAMRRRFTEAVTVVEHIEKMIAPDPYLDVLRSNLLTSANLAHRAAQAATQAIEREPDLIEARWALVAATLKQPDYVGTTNALLAIHTLFHVVPQLEGVPEYAGYVASPEYAKLKKALSPSP